MTLWSSGSEPAVEPVATRHARDEGVICGTLEIHVMSSLVTPKVRGAEELPGFKWGQSQAKNQAKIFVLFVLDDVVNGFTC